MISSNLKIVRWMNTSKSTKRFLYTSTATLSPLLPLFMLCSLKDIYMHVTKANCGDSEQRHRIIQISQLVWMGYGCAMESVSVAQVCQFPSSRNYQQPLTISGPFIAFLKFCIRIIIHFFPSLCVLGENLSMAFVLRGR